MDGNRLPNGQKKPQKKIKKSLKKQLTNKMKCDKMFRLSVETDGKKTKAADAAIKNIDNCIDIKT